MVAFVAIFLVGYFFFSKNNSSSETVAPQKTNEVSESKSLRDLLASGIAQKCTYSTNVDGAASEGVTFTSNGKVRSDFTFTEGDKITKTHMINDGKVSYVWTDETKTGFKMIFDNTNPETDTQSVSVQGGTDWDEKFDYKCVPSIIDDSTFTPPSDVEFTDFANLLN